MAIVKNCVQDIVNEKRNKNVQTSLSNPAFWDAGLKFTCKLLWARAIKILPIEFKK